MVGHAKKCVERYCELANKTTQQLYKVSTPCIDDHHFKEEEMKSVGELPHVCSQIVLKCLYLARIGRLDILWSVNKLARSITKWTKACDKRLNRLISYESEIISLDTGLRLDGLPALDLWDLIVSVFGNVSRVSYGSGQPDSDVHKRHESHKENRCDERH